MEYDDEVKKELASVEFEGEPVKLGKKYYIVPSLSMKQAKALWPEILKLDSTGVTAENMPEKHETIVTIIHAALARNYPNLSREELEGKVDMANIRKLMLIVSAQSGFKPGEQKPAVDLTPTVH